MPSYCEDPETGAIKRDAVDCRQVPQDPPVESHALVVADGIDGVEALRSRQLSPPDHLHCWRRDVTRQTRARESARRLGVLPSGRRGQISSPLSLSLLTCFSF